MQWPNDADAEYEYDSDAERRRAIEEKIASQQEDSIGMGPGRTGVKGVIRDRDEANAMQRAKRADEVRALNKQMEKASLGGKTWAEEEEERLAEKAREEGKTVQELRSRGEAQARDDAQARRGRFGHLREVGLKGYLQAIESEERHVWVVVHIYDPVSLGPQYLMLISQSLMLWSVVAGSVCYIRRLAFSHCSPPSLSKVPACPRWCHRVCVRSTYCYLVLFFVTSRTETTVQTHSYTFSQNSRARPIPHRRG